MLIKRVEWLFKELKARKSEMSLSSAPSIPIITQCLTFLDGFINRKRDVFEASVQTKRGDKSILMLTYYRNHLIHHFVNEALIAVAFLGISNIQNVTLGVAAGFLWEKVIILQDLLQGEFIIRKRLATYSDFLATLKFLDSRGFLSFKDDTVSIDPKNENQSYGQSFLCHLLLPLVESYWITLTFFLSQQETPHDEEGVYNKVQWVMESLCTGGLVKFYEACMLQTIKNAVQQFSSSGVLAK